MILTVVIYFIPSEVPAPGVLIVANQGLEIKRMLLLSKSPPSHLIADRVEGSVLRGDPHHGVSPALPGGPAELEHVQTSLVTNLQSVTVKHWQHWQHWCTN